MIVNLIALDNFISTYSGKMISYPKGMYAGECLSLVKLWIREYYKVSPPPSGIGAAIGYWTRFPKPLNSIFRKVSVSDDIIMRGDIVLWSRTNKLPYGHIAICVETTENDFASFDQNWGTGKIRRLAHIEVHDYKGVVGYLRENV